MIINMTDDFNLSRIADSGQCFRWQKLDENRYRILHGAYCLYIDDLGECQYNLSCDENQYKKIWKEYFDTETNYREIRKKIDPMTDPFLWAAAEAEKGIRILRQDPWEMLITFIISQNRNIPAIKNSVELLVETCGEYKEDDRGISYHAFPTPEAISSLSESELISCRLGYRWKYVRSAAKAVTDRNIDLDDRAAAHS